MGWGGSIAVVGTQRIWLLHHNYCLNIMEQIKIMQAANINSAFNHQGPVQNIVSLTSSLRGQLVKCFTT